jgi:hypothetical protein
MPPSLCSRHGFLRPTSTTPLGTAPHRQARTHRRRVRTTTSPEPGRLPSDRPRPRGRSGPGCARFYTRTLQSRTLSLAAIHSGHVKWSSGRFKLPLVTHQALRPDTALPGKMRLTDVCNRPTTRAPCEPLDSRLRLHMPCGLLRAPTRGRGHGLHLGGASLDGDPPASALDAHRVATRYPSCLGHGANEIPLGPGGCRDRRPLRRYPPAAVFSTARRAGDVASDALVASSDLRPGFRPAGIPGSAFASPVCAGRQTRFRRRLVKDDCFHRPERLPSTSAPSACFRRPHWEPATGSRLCRRVPASDARSPLGPPFGGRD